MVMYILWICVVAAFVGIAVTIVGNTMLASARKTLDAARRLRSSLTDLDALEAKIRRGAQLRRIGAIVTFVALTIGGPLAEYEWWRRGIMDDTTFIVALSLHAVSVVVAIWVFRKGGY